MEKILEEILKELKEVKSEVKDVKSELSVFKRETNERFESLEVEVKDIKTQQVENTQILNSLERKAEVNKAEMDNLVHQNVRIEGTINNIKKDVGDLRKDINAVEVITAKNWNDIVHLKAIK
ncbi:MAG: hypothetical protein N4A62_05335 [Marinisporobacter sp.]|jgi:chromosome segregation ATPase|nr:hypothetical protein [Marinisporobacter sp.]